MLQKKFEEWKHEIKQNDEFRKVIIHEGVFLHVSNNPYGIAEAELQKYKDNIKKCINLLQNCTEKTLDNEMLLQILKHFDLFLNGFFRGTPHGKSTIDTDKLKTFHICNEYDLQYILYCYLKPIYPLSRTEVPENTGYETVRTDIYIDEQTVIETKCSRASMSEKKLIEEIEADITHYSASHIFFYIYDKEKIINNPELFIKTYENKIHEKDIHIVILQPNELI